MNILVVEDDFHNRVMVGHLLRLEKHAVEEVDNPEGALRMIERQPPHLIMLDVNFGTGHLNGFEMFAEMRRRADGNSGHLHDLAG